MKTAVEHKVRRPGERRILLLPGGETVLAAERLVDSLRDLIDAWKHRVQQHGMIRHRDVRYRETLDRCIHVPKAVLRDSRRDFSVEACREIVLMNDHAVARLYNRRQHARAIPWSDGP